MKKWALESPELELGVKRYKVFSARDLSIKKIFSNRAWTEKQKTPLEKCAFRKRKRTLGQRRKGMRFPEAKMYSQKYVLTEIRFHLKHAGPGLVRDVRLTGGAGCNAPRPTLQKTSSYSEFRCVILFCSCIHLCIICIASCHHIINFFKTQLNKLYGFFDPFKLREFTRDFSL